MSRREYARHRRCDTATVQRAVAAGLIPVGRNKRILVEKADALWEPGQRRADSALTFLGGGSADPAAARRKPTTSVAEAVVAEALEDQRRLLAAKARREEWRERREQLAYERERKDVLPRVDIRTDAQQTAEAVVATLTSLGARLSTALSCACRDPGQVQRLVDIEVRRAREALCKSLFIGEEDRLDASA